MVWPRLYLHEQHDSQTNQTNHHCPVDFGSARYRRSGRNVASWFTGSGKQTSPRTAAKMHEGGEFGRTTNQQNCIDEGVKRGARLGLLNFDAQIDNEDFVLGCLQSRAITPGFCDGVPSGVKNIFVDWTQRKV